MKIELDEDVVNHFKKYFGSEGDLQEKMEEAVNGLLKDWIRVEHTRREEEIVKGGGKGSSPSQSRVRQGKRVKEAVGGEE